MCLMVWKRTFYVNVDLSTTCQCQQLGLNPLSTQIKIYCLMTNQKPALLVQRAQWTRAAVMLLQSLYFSRPSSPPRSPQELYSPTPAPSVHLKIKIPVTVRRGKSKRSHEKIGDCAQSKGRKDTENEVVWLSKESWNPQGLQKQKQWRWIAISQPPTHGSLLLVLRSVRGARVLRDTSLPISYPQSSNSRLAGGRFKAAKWPVWPRKKKSTNAWLV